MRKFIVFLICMLVFTTSIPVIKSSIFDIQKANNYYKNNPSNYTSNGTELPIWTIGDKWIYDLDLSFEQNMNDTDVSLGLTLNNLELYLEDINGDYYDLSIFSNIAGNFYMNVEGFPQLSGFLKQTEINGNLLVEKNNLGIKEFNFNIDGILRVSILPINLDIDISITFEPSYISLGFPLEIGKEWRINETYISMEGIILLPGIAQLFPNIPDEITIENISYLVGGNNALCIGKENITINSGIYTCYNISIDDSINIFYSPVNGNIIKIIPLLDFDLFDFQFSFELVSTTYLVPGAPNKPDTPEGPNRGEPDLEYTFSTSSTDNEGNEIYYYFDWGDGNTSGWLGPYNSGETVTSNHSWLEKGSYTIRAKAKDTENNESPWSNPLYISMPKSKIQNIKLFLNTIFEKISNRLSI